MKKFIINFPIIKETRLFFVFEKYRKLKFKSYLLGHHPEKTIIGLFLCRASLMLPTGYFVLEF